MNIRRVIINSLCFVFIGVVLGFNGIGVTNWGYWAIFLSVVGVMFNSGID